jgi:hypothetical protein
VKVFYTVSETRLYFRETWQIEEKRRRFFLALTFKKTNENRGKRREKKRKEKKRKEKRRKKKKRGFIKTDGKALKAKR